MFAPADHHPNLRMFKPDSLQRIVQLDVDAEVVRVELQSIPGAQATGFIDVHGQCRDGIIDGQSPMPVSRWIGLKIDWCIGGRVCLFMHGVFELPS
jgi:hypothetical protein